MCAVLLWRVLSCRPPCWRVLGPLGWLAGLANGWASWLAGLGWLAGDPLESFGVFSRVGGVKISKFYPQNTYLCIVLGFALYIYIYI